MGKCLKLFIISTLFSLHIPRVSAQEKWLITSAKQPIYTSTSSSIALSSSTSSASLLIPSLITVAVIDAIVSLYIILGKSCSGIECLVLMDRGANVEFNDQALASATEVTESDVQNILFSLQESFQDPETEAGIRGGIGRFSSLASFYGQNQNDPAENKTLRSVLRGENIRQAYKIYQRILDKKTAGQDSHLAATYFLNQTIIQELENRTPQLSAVQKIVSDRLRAREWLFSKKI